MFCLSSSHLSFTCFCISFVVPHLGLRVSIFFFCSGMFLFLSFCNYLSVISSFLSWLSIILLQNSYNCPFWVNGSLLQPHIKLWPSATIYATDMGALFPYVHLIMTSCVMFSTLFDFPTSNICSFVCFMSLATVCFSLTATFTPICKAWLLVINSWVLLCFLYGGRLLLFLHLWKTISLGIVFLTEFSFFITVRMDHFVEKSICFVKKLLGCNNLISSFLLANFSLWLWYFAIYLERFLT